MFGKSKQISKKTYFFFVADNQRLEISKMGFLLTLLLVHAPR